MEDFNHHIGEEKFVAVLWFDWSIVVLLHHLLLYSLILLIQLKSLLFVNGERFKLGADFARDSHNVRRIEEVVLEKMCLIAFGHGTNCASMKAASARARSL